jgi:phage repressor protein C with HTH and peptisase S24 domain
VERAINKRIKEIIDYLSISDAEFSKKIGIPQTTISNIFNRDSDVKYTVLNAIVTRLGFISPEWLLTGEGKMSKPSDNTPSLNYERRGAPYYNVDFLGGFDILHNDQTINPDYYIDFEPYNKKGYLWCNLYGKSMEPLITSGEKIVMHEVNVSEIIYGEVYAIITKSNMRTVKRVVRSDNEKCIRLIPENKNPIFGDYQDIELQNILTIFRVDGSFKLF